MVDALHLTEIIKQKGFRLTIARQNVVDMVCKSLYPFTAEEMYAQLKEQGIGRATVFRTLKLLQELDVLVRVHLEEGCQHYQLSAATINASHCHTEDHHHDRIICRHCGEISYLDECPMKTNVNEIAKRSGYRIQGHHLDLYGVCRGCDK